MSILNFLLYWSNRVYEWFGWLYERGRNAALYAWDWAVNQGRIAYNLAVNYAITVYNNAITYAWNTIQSVYNQVLGFISPIWDWVLVKLGEVYSWSLGKLVELKTWWEVKKLELFDWINHEIDRLSVWVFTEVNKAIAKIMPIIQPYLDILNQEVDEVKADIEKRFGWVVEKDSTGNTILYTFLNNPLGFIMAYVWSRFSELLTFGLAYGFGSVKYDLPPVPEWSSPGLSGGYLPPSSGPPGASGLLSPLKSLSVSGYRFAPDHKGIDYGLANGDPVYAMHDGEVTLVHAGTSGYGYYVILSGGAWWSLYAHLGDISVAKGQRVKAGTVLGRGDSTGNSTGPHLHLEIKYNGVYIDPLTVL